MLNRYLLLILVALLISACQPQLLDPPRSATQTAEAEATPQPSSTPIRSLAPTPTGQANGQPFENRTPESSTDHKLTMWVNETDQAHVDGVREFTEAFTRSSGTQVEVMFVSPRLLPELVQTAAISNTLPDLILHPVSYTNGWVEKGILDPEATTRAINLLGNETFNPEALTMVSLQDGRYGAVPSDGWQQLIIYRSDWFAKRGLLPPTDYSTLQTAAETLYDPEGSVSGLVVPTDASLVETQQVFEFLAKANGCNLVEQSGRIALLHPACLEALEYYRFLINSYSPIGFQTDVSALNAYLAGRTGIIVASPAALPALAGLDPEAQPTCPECLDASFLAQNSGFVANFQGVGEFAGESGFHELTALGITSEADSDVVASFVDFWFNEAYEEWLGIDPERKVPQRWGDQNNPTRYLDAWSGLPLIPNGLSITEIFGEGLVNILRDNFQAADRWGFTEGQGEVVAITYQDLILAPLLQEMLSGYFTSSQTIVEMYQEVARSIPDYQFPIEVVPTPTP